MATELRIESWLSVVKRKDIVATKYRTYLIFGAPGSGKGTQGRTLGTIPRFFHCACGDVFRSIDTRTSLGKAFLEYSSRGSLFPMRLPSSSGGSAFNSASTRIGSSPISISCARWYSP